MPIRLACLARTRGIKLMEWDLFTASSPHFQISDQKMKANTNCCYLSGFLWSKKSQSLRSRDMLLLVSLSKPSGAPGFDTSLELKMRFPSENNFILLVTCLPYSLDQKHTVSYFRNNFHIHIYSSNKCLLPVYSF
jgi:hypothetical protein